MKINTLANCLSYNPESICILQNVINVANNMLEAAKPNFVADLIIITVLTENLGTKGKFPKKL